MKHFLAQLCFPAIAALLLVSSCKLEEPFLTISEGEVIEVPSATFTQSISINTNNPWTARVSDDWITLSPSEGSKGNTTVTLTVKENTTYGERHATITISSQSIEYPVTIRQNQNDAFILKETSFEIGTAGGNISIPIRYNADYSCEVEKSAQGWLSIDRTKALNDGQIVVSVKENDTYDQRTGKVNITLGKQKASISITQSQKDEVLVGQKEFETGSTGGTIRVPVSANTEYSCDVIGTASEWLTVETSRTKGLEEYFIVLKVAPNEGYDGRVGQVKVSGAGKESVVTVSQSQKDEILVGQKEFETGSTGGTVRVPVSTNTEYSCNVIGSASEWLTVETSRTKGLEEYFIVLKVAPNEGYDGRVGQVKVSGAGKESIVTVNQLQKDAILSGQERYEISFRAQTIEMEISANVDNVKTTSSVDWIKITEAAGTKGLTARKYVATIDKNNSLEKREGVITFIYDSVTARVTITQEGKDELLNETMPGIYGIPSGNWIYSPFAEQQMITRNKGLLSYSALNIADDTWYTISGLPENVQDEETVTLEMTHNITCNIQSGTTYNATVLQMDDDRVWLKTQQGTGFIIMTK